MLTAELHATTPPFKLILKGGVLTSRPDGPHRIADPDIPPLIGTYYCRELEEQLAARMFARMVATDLQACTPVTGSSATVLRRNSPRTSQSFDTLGTATDVSLGEGRPARYGEESRLN